MHIIFAICVTADFGVQGSSRRLVMHITFAICVTADVGMQGLSLDVSTAGSIARSLQALREGCTDKAVMEVVTLLATKPMKVSACSLAEQLTSSS